MTELERELRALAASVRWPETPALELRLAERPRRRRFAVAVALAVLTAVTVTLAVPAARSAVLRVLHLGGVAVKRVDTLPRVPRRPLDAGLGPVVTRAAAQAALGRPAALTPNARSAAPHLRDGVVSFVLPGPTLLSELRTGPVPVVAKELGASATHASWFTLNKLPALWITGAPHMVRFPAAPARLAGNVLVWQSGPITFRLEGPRLDRTTAVGIARRLTGT